ncbi:MAG: hypothetical protein FWB98_07830 [Defluviitaleaceae bacterium]|nr:hypothetical protein [Defluviitaleaceae bacterium]
MKKTKLRITAMVMAAFMVFMAMPVNASERRPTTDLSPYPELSLEANGDITSVDTFEFEGMHFTLRTVETPTGDRFFYEYHDGVLINRAAIYANQADRIMHTTFTQSDNADSRAIETENTVIMLHELGEVHSEDVVDPLNVPSPGDLISGVISFRHEDSSPWTQHQVRLNTSSVFLGTTSVRIRNQTATLATWGATITSALGLAAWKAGAVSGLVISSIGAVFTVVGWFVSHMDVSVDVTRFTYNLTYLGRPNNSVPLILTRHRVNDFMQPHLMGITFWTGGSPWSIRLQMDSLWRQFAFAEIVHWQVFRGSPFRWSVTSWL